MARLAKKKKKKKHKEFHLFSFVLKSMLKLRSSSLFVIYTHVNSKILFHQKLMSFDTLIKLS